MAIRLIDRALFSGRIGFVLVESQVVDLPGGISLAGLMFRETWLALLLASAFLALGGFVRR
jgi:hypothetical protein